MKRRRNKSNKLIDLTSLLDVVFIILLVVMCQLQETKNTYAAKEESIQQQENDFNELKKLYSDQIESLGSVSDYISYITVNAQYDEDLVTRHITILNSDKQSEIPEIPQLKGLRVSDGYDELNKYLSTYVAENPERVVVLSFNEDDEDILYRDEKAIKEIFTQLSSEYPNIREK
ncbi:hypothetical protein [Butyrivibrio sp. INlla16]|uniref:hypothetical protein n=1 Tax=Butyrivibrio sp. INlla16 TaxID=1520807 RepID=UPI00088E3BAA|nr:hypothetical protein [Butyrivibrio sp. INlla16]SDB56844.1 hypothetical protein SAMN02910263_02905 [Butyrivibrio sp. INlla16]